MERIGLTDLDQLNCPNCGSTLRSRWGIAVAVKRHAPPRDILPLVRAWIRYCGAEGDLCYAQAGYLVDQQWLPDPDLLPLGGPLAALLLAAEDDEDQSRPRGDPGE